MLDLKPRTFGTSSHDPDVGPSGLRPSTRTSSPSDLRRWTLNLGLRIFGTSSHDPDVGPSGLLSHDPDLRDFVSRPGCRTFGAPPSTRTPSPSDLRRWTSNLRPLGLRLTTRMSDLQTSDATSNLGPSTRTLGSVPRLRQVLQTSDVRPRTSDFLDLRDFVSRPGCRTLGLRPRLERQVLQTSDAWTSNLGLRTFRLRLTTRMSDLWGSALDSNVKFFRPQTLGPEPSDFGPSGLRLTTRMSDLGAPPLDSNVKSFRPQTWDSNLGLRTFGTSVSRPGCWTFGAPPSTRTSSPSDLRR